MTALGRARDRLQRTGGRPLRTARRRLRVGILGGGALLLLHLIGCAVYEPTEQIPLPAEGEASRRVPTSAPWAAPEPETPRADFSEEEEGVSLEEPTTPEVAPEPSVPAPAPASPRASEEGWAGPLPWRSWVRTTIFGRYKPLASLFASQRKRADGRTYRHQGVDVLAPLGTPLVAPNDGVVVRAGAWDPSGYGRAVLIRVRRGGRDYYVLYAHMDEISVSRGQRVRRGQRVGTAGKSGNAHNMPKKEEHVHVEVRVAEEVGRGLDGRVDPLDFFPLIVAPKELKR